MLAFQQIDPISTASRPDFYGSEGLNDPIPTGLTPNSYGSAVYFNLRSVL